MEGSAKPSRQTLRIRGARTLPGEEVSGEVIKIFKAIAVEVGGHEGCLFHGMEHLLDGRSRFSWPEHCELYRRAFRLVRTAPDAFAAQMVLHPTFAPLLRLVGLVASPSLLFLVGNRFGIARTYRHLKAEQIRRADGRIELRLTIPEGYEDSPEFFQATRGILQALPRQLGLPSAQVELELEPLHGRYVIQLPPSMTLWARIKRAFAAFHLGRSALRELARQQELLNEQVRDLTHAREDLERALEAKQRFLSVISHELRTPLNGLVGGASAVRSAETADQRRELVESIQQSSEAMQRVVLDLLEYNRLEETRAQPEPIQTTVEMLFADVLRRGRQRAEEIGLDLDVREEEVLGPIEIDAQRAQRVAWHLVDNACKFTSEGRLRIEIRVTGDTRAELLFVVDDSGPGVESRDRDRIFSLFAMQDDSSTRRTGGTGIGLSLSRRLTRFLGGTLHVEDSDLGGARFVLRIPCRRVEVSDPVSHQRGSCPRLLVVDDNRVNRKVLRHILERLQWEVIEAENGQEAVKRVQEYPFAAIFMDCAMPVMDGFEATREIRRLIGQRTCVIATTAYVTDVDRAQCFAAGMNDFLSKPVKPAVIAQALERWTGGVSPESVRTAQAAG